MSGSFAGATLRDVESRAKKAGWKVLGSGSDALGAATRMDLELDSGEHYAYVTLVDIGEETNGAKHAGKMGKTVALSLSVESGSGAKATRADVLLDQALATQPIDTLTKDNFTQALAKTGWKIQSASTESQDGLRWTMISAFNGKDEALDVDLFELADAAKDGRVALDGDRFMNVFVCKECNRKQGKLAEAWQRSKARKLVMTLASP